MMWLCAIALLVAEAVAVQCPSYSSYSQQLHEPFSLGAHQLPYQRPAVECRTFSSPAVEKVITDMKSVIADPDLYRLFENTYPNTLDTAIAWRGFAANNTEEDLCFLITGDINAMWLRDSANQMQPYRSVLNSSTDDLASLFRGVINLQARYLNVAPYCNAFLPPPEAGIPSSPNGAPYHVTPSYDRNAVFTCNFELDSFAAFLEISHDYYNATADLDFFGKFQWVSAVESILRVSTDMMEPMFAPDGTWIQSSYTFSVATETFSGTLGNHGLGNPTSWTGMIRSPFRPSDDTSIYEFLVPANLMLARYLDSCADIMGLLGNATLAKEMTTMATTIRDGVEKFAIVPSPVDGHTPIYAFEVDGYGGRNLMDDANIPSLLSLPFFGAVNQSDPIYQSTREFVLSAHNPWYSRGPVISAVGSPHVRPGTAWPMASIVRILTSDDDIEILDQLKEIVSSTGGLGLIHESVDSHNANSWSRQW